MLDATVVSDILEAPLDVTGGVGASSGGGLSESAVIAVEIVDEVPSFVDTEAEVEDDLSDPKRVALKFFDVLALLIEKILFHGLPTIVSGGTLVWERLDNAVNGAKGRRGWRLLQRLKEEPVGRARTDSTSTAENV